MDLNHTLTRLLAAARRQPPSEAVPYAFEQRMMARLAGARVEDNWALWGRALLRAATVCMAVSVLFSAWSTWPRYESETATLEDAVFAAAEQPGDLW